MADRSFALAEPLLQDEVPCSVRCSRKVPIMLLLLRGFCFIVPLCVVHQQHTQAQISGITMTEQAASTKVNKAELRKQLEYYLSDKNLMNDKIFHKTISEDPEGWLPLSLILRCNRIKAMNATTEVILDALKGSEIEIRSCADLETAIRRPNNKELPELKQDARDALELRDECYTLPTRARNGTRGRNATNGTRGRNATRALEAKGEGRPVLPLPFDPAVLPATTMKGRHVAFQHGIGSPWRLFGPTEGEHSFRWEKPKGKQVTLNEKAKQEVRNEIEQYASKHGVPFVDKDSVKMALLFKQNLWVSYSGGVSNNLLQLEHKNSSST